MTARVRPVALPLLLAVLVCTLVASAGATQFKVGGQQGWSVPAAGSESYNTWAGRLRFQIGDQLLFVYPKETDSVLLVDAAAYNACNTSSPVAKFDDGSTVFTFDRSGPFFFISGNEASCRANEKLIVVVLADRSGGGGGGTGTPPPASTPVPSPPGSPPAAAPAPATTPPSSSPPAAAPVPAPAATTPTSPPSPAPVPAPTTTAPSSPPAPAAPSPSATPTPGGAASPPPSGSATAPAGDAGTGSTTPPPPSAAAPVVAGFVGSLGAFIGYAMLAA